MGAMFSLVLAKLSAILGWFGSLFVAVFVALWDMITDVFCWVLEQLFSVVTSALQAADFNGFVGYSAGNTLPAEIGNVLSLLGVGTAITIIVLAITIRLGLQLIPFVRLGS